MKIREAIIKNYNDLPGYKLVGYSEIAIPMYQRKIHVLSLIEKTIPVVEEFVLNFYKEGLNIEEIKMILGLEQELIDEAIAGLIQKDYIDSFTKKITILGETYLKNNKVEALEKQEFSIIIDGITGEVKKNNNNLILNKNIRSKGLRAIRANIEKPSIDELEFKSLQKVFNEYKEYDSETYNGTMIDIVHMEGNTTKYRKVDLLLFENDEKDVRLITFDGFNRLQDYEEKMKEIDLKGITLLKNIYGQYFQSDDVNKINNIISSSNNSEVIKYENINKIYDEYLNDFNENILIVLPLISNCKISQALVDKIESKIKSRENISILLCGKDFIGENQKKMCKELKKLSLKNKEFLIMQTPKYFNKMVLNVKCKKGIISLYEKNKIELNSTKEGIVEKFFEIKDNDFDYIYNLLSSNYDQRESIKFIPYKNNKKELLSKIENLIYLVKDADGYMFNNDNIGWVESNGIPEIQRLKESPLANNEENFRIFIDSLNKSLVESLENNAKEKCQNKYFWNDFKINYPELQRVLNKIKTYRNKYNHLELNEKNKERYYEFLKEDMNGYMPEFIENGYLILQFKLLDELKKYIESLIIELK